MEFKEKLLASHLAFEERIDFSDPVHQTRLESLKTTPPSMLWYGRIMPFSPKRKAPYNSKKLRNTSFMK